MKRDFKGIWIPREIWLNKDLTIMERLFLVEIDSLDAEKGCFATNAHFAEVFDVSKGRCTQIIKSLEAKGCVKITLVRDGKQISKRTVRVVNKLNTLFNKLNQPSENIKHPYLENDEGSNTNTNNTKEGKARALDFLQLNFPSRFEVEIMRVKSKIKNWKKFCLDFNDTVDGENLFYSDKVLFARFGKYSRNWIQNQEKFSGNEENAKPVYHRKIS